MSFLTPLMLKSALPLTLAVSPLLLAAAQPPVLDSIGPDCRLAVGGSGGGQGASEGANGMPERGAIAQPVNNSTEVLVTSQQEMSIFSGERLATALRLLLTNPYANTNDGSSVRSQNRCISQNESPVLESSLLAASPSFQLIAQSDNLPILEPAGGSSSAPVPAAEPTVAPIPTGPAISTPVAEPPVETVPAAAPPEVSPSSVSPAPPTSVAAPATPPAPVARPAIPVAVPNTGRPASSDPTNVTPTTVNPTPYDGRVVRTLASLADGNYRYLAGATPGRTYSDEEIAQQGASLFLLRKEGNRITGTLFLQWGQPGICITGIASGNTVTGAAYPYSETDIQQARSRENIDALVAYGAYGELQVRRAQVDKGQAYYTSAVLNLSDYAMINAGSSVPPTGCGATE